MKPDIRLVIIVMLLFGPVACDHKEHDHQHGEHAHDDHHSDEEEAVHLSQAQFDALGMNVGALPKRSLSATVQVNGNLEVPPQNEAAVTAILGANVVSIQVIEGDDVQKGQVLAYLSHPNLTLLQSNYLEAYNRHKFLEKDYQRQKKLYEEEVSSGKNYQQTEADFHSAQAMVKSYEGQLRQLGLNPARIREGSFYDQVPVLSPIDGSITRVEVKTGQYVEPQKDLFEIVNVEHIHADLMVFEKDVHRVKKDQRVRFKVESMPGKELYARIYSVGKKFEQYPKAVHVHAEIENKSGNLIPGMYISGEVMTDSSMGKALLESAITREGEGYIAFTASREENGWRFTPVTVVVGNHSNGWVAVELPDSVEVYSQFALNNAYYLVAEMKKGEAEHSH